MNSQAVLILLVGGVYVGVMLAWRRFRMHQIKRWWTAGHDALAGGNAETAAAAFRKCLRAWPAAPNFHEALGTALSQLGKLEEAEQELRLAVDLEPSRAQSHMNLALFYAFAAPGRERDAVEAFARVRELDPALADAVLAKEHIAARLEDAARRCGTAATDTAG